MSSHVKNVAIVGGTGQIGSQILSALLSTKAFNITAVTRSESSSSFPTGVTVKKGDYDSDSFFVEALQGQDVLILALAFQAPPELQSRLTIAAAKASVPFILPNEYGSDNDHPNMRDNIPVNTGKTQYRDQIEQLKKSSWIGIVNNPWYDYSLLGGWFGIDIKNRSATFYDDGLTKFNTTTRSTVGLAVAKLLSLPITSSGNSPSLSDYANKFVYISSFHVSQRDILTSVQKATNTTDADWNIERKSVQEYLDESLERVKNGDYFGMAGILYGHHFREGSGGDFSKTRQVANKIFGLPEEDLDSTTKSVIEGMNL